MNLRFESAINPYGCSPRVVEAMQQFAATKDYRFYGDPTSLGLREKLAAHFDLAPENFVVYNGSGEALKDLYLIQLVLKKASLIAPYPSYERFVDGGKRFAPEFIEAPLERETWKLPVDQLIAEAQSKKAAMAMMSSPNNPTGNILLTEEDLCRMLEAAPQCLWVIDEAYADYPGVSFARLVKKYSNLAILRTFSKAYGLAGMRIGYMITHPMLAIFISQIRLPWCVNSMSLLAAETALEDQDHLKETLSVIKDDVKKFYEQLSAFPAFKVYPSDANFFLVEVADGKQPALVEYLAAKNINVRTRPDMPEYIRVTSLLPDENQVLLQAFRDFGL